MVLTSFPGFSPQRRCRLPHRSSNAVEPTPYDLLSGDVTVRKQFYRWSAALGAGVESYDFGSTRAQDGSTIRQDARDGQIYALHGRTDYAFSPGLGWYAAAEYNIRELRGTPTQSSTRKAMRALTGVNIALTDLSPANSASAMCGSASMTAAIGTIDGPAWSAMLTWRPTRMLDVNFKAEQIVTQTSDTSATGVIANSFQLGVDYELLRNIVVSVAGGAEKDKFHGQPRNDRSTPSTRA